MTEFESCQKKIMQCEQEIGKGIIGQKDVIRQVILAMLAGGNVLLEGMPGLGKTMLVRTISEVLALTFKRIQFTPDLMPSDVTGTNIMVKEDARSSFRFEQGPIFANLVLADEINLRRCRSIPLQLETKVTDYRSRSLFLRRRIRSSRREPIRSRRHSWIVSCSRF